MTRRWTHRPDGSNWGDFGDDDQVGRLNLITPAVVREAVQEVKEGRSFLLSLPLDYPRRPEGATGHRHPPVLRPAIRNGRPYFGYEWAQDLPGTTDVLSDDAAILYLQYSTHWDALCHVGHRFDADGDGVAEAVLYNGYRIGEDLVGPADVADAGAVGTVPAVQTTSVSALDVAAAATTCVQGRGVMIDLEAHFGRGQTVVGYDELRTVLDADAIEVGAGDLVCLHTGYAQTLLDRGEAVGAGLDGRDPRLLDWITETGLAALICDNPGVEIYPYPEYPEGPHAAMPLHEHCLFKLGVHIGELWYLTELAAWLRANGRTRFLLTAPPLRLSGAVGSPVSPVATV